MMLLAPPIGTEGEGGEGTQPFPAPSAGSARIRLGSVEVAGTAVGQLVADRYRIDSQLGRGGMGAVWLAHDRLLGRLVAVKQVSRRRHPDQFDALTEARAAARVTHPGIVRVHDIVMGEKDAWIVMEALPGAPLSTVLRERGRLPVRHVTSIGLQLLSALEALHDADLVHRDVKPSNVQLRDDDRAVLIDFGLSSPSGVAGRVGTTTITGSLPYMAPETITHRSFGPPSDMYALGVTLYEAVEGHRPFGTGTPESLLAAVLSATRAPMRHAGPLRQVIDGLLDKDPAMRMDADTARRHLQAICL
jgi:eukaryotic-like serine/threonine-protein kinase